MTFPKSQAQCIQDVVNCFPVWTISELAARHPSVPWCEYMNHLLCPVGKTCIFNHDRVMVNMPRYLFGLESVIRSTSKRVLANYMVWRAVASCVAFADRRLRDRQQVS